MFFLLPYPQDAAANGEDHNRISGVDQEKLLWPALELVLACHSAGDEPDAHNETYQQPVQQLISTTCTGRQPEHVVEILRGALEE